MNILLSILGVLAAVIVLLLIIALFSKKSYTVEREIIINRPNEEVFSYIKHLKNQDNYSKWVMTDPDMKKTFTGNDGSIGFVYAWEENKKAGKGEQEIMGIKPNERIDVEVRFEKPFAGIASVPFSTERVSEYQTRLRWGMTSQMNYPMNLMLLLMNVDKMLGNDMQQSLVKLKGILEA
ncbi:SRPBCC family protein [Solitalea canadensis]|uniref:Polyketide cyclase / dehydrase and lipid transport n=1 Tax=Solitalea canadensis (strain ATCC 29591 / DSM 3403 / JCM 21819 / LMG 8368 / NBRC 15130 / NCIMB 12057 / USAM 9D) TaxID=929556 RepID=H8KVJ2_SOLCM|nr:SRPBCC family protein [Solitalea canadensis]AFD06495.1 Polyketide cyclase / dehydrase and lipid transport [Solitalea canadensis DSM 3403]